MSLLGLGPSAAVAFPPLAVNEHDTLDGIALSIAGYVTSATPTSEPSP